MNGYKNLTKQELRDTAGGSIIIPVPISLPIRIVTWVVKNWK